MAPSSRHRGPGQRAGLDRETVLTAARGVLAEQGAAGLTMRGLATRLGVAPNALYSHVENKTELLDLVLDDVLGAVAIPSAETVADDPLGAVRSVMLASYDVLLRHADLMPAFLARQGARGPMAQQLGVVTVDALDRAGVDEVVARDALSVLIVNTIGFAAFTSEAGLVAAETLRGTYVRALDWLLAGMTS